MNGSNGDFPYWEGDRTQPGGVSESNIRPEQLEALHSYLGQRAAAIPPNNFTPPPYQPPAVEAPRSGSAMPSAVREATFAIPGKGLTLTISTSEMRLDITMTPL